MITLTRLDGNSVCVNEINILWVEALPDTSVMLLGGTRILVREPVPEVKRLINDRAAIWVQGSGLTAREAPKLQGEPAACLEPALRETP